MFFQRYFHISAALLPGLCALGFLLLSAGCSSPSLPPGLHKDNGGYSASFAEELSAETKYAYLSWQIELRRDSGKDKNLLEYLALLQEQALSESKLQLAEKITAMGGDFTRLDAKGSLRFNPVVFAEKENWQEIFSFLEKLRSALKTPPRILPEDAETDLLFGPGQESVQAEFSAWLAKRSLELPDSPILPRQELLQELDRIQDTVSLKRRLLDSCAEANALLKSGNGLKALNLLDETSRLLSDHSSLSLIGDTKTLAALERERRELPGRILEQALAAAEQSMSAELEANSSLEQPRTQNTLESLEREFSAKLQLWQEDQRFKTSLSEYKERLQSLLGKAAKWRAGFWQEELARLAEQNEFWQAALRYQEFRALLSNADSAELGLYFKLRSDNAELYAEQIQNEVKTKFISVLPAAFKHYFAAIDYASNIANTHGISLTLCKMLQSLSELAGGDHALPEECRLALPKMRTYAEQSKRNLVKDSLQRALHINEMSSGSPGLGMTYARDLENVLRGLTQNEGLLPWLKVAENNQPQSSRDYVIYGGIIADYNAGELVERSSMRSVIRHDEIQKISNPDYNAEASANAPLRQSAKYLYRQNELEQVITVKEIERLAHLRVFFNLKGPGVTELLELNEFYSRKFAIEQSHLFEDVHRKRSIEAYDRMELTVPEAPPSLLNDRVWSSGEMLDFARKDSLYSFAVKLLYQLQYFPLFLAQRAEKFAQEGEWQEAAEYWGRCYAVCEELNTPADIADVFKFSQSPSAACYENDMRKLIERQEQLKELKRSAAEKAFAQTCAYLRQKKS